MDQDLVGSREAADGQLGERWVGTPRAQRWAWWCRDKPGSSGVSPTTPFVLSGWWRYTDGEGNSSSTSWGGPWSDFYDETVTDHGFYAGAYYVLDYGGGREEYFAHLGDAFSEYASYDSGFFAFAYSNEQRVWGRGQTGYSGQFQVQPEEAPAVCYGAAHDPSSAAIRPSQDDNGNILMRAAAAGPSPIFRSWRLLSTNDTWRVAGRLRCSLIRRRRSSGHYVPMPALPSAARRRDRLVFTSAATGSAALTRRAAFTLSAMFKTALSP